MRGAFGGLLRILERLGLDVQRGVRRMLWLLIGDPALRWDLKTLSREHDRFKQQRGAREVLGGLALAILVVALGVPSGFVEAAALGALVFLAVMGLAMLIRSYLELPPP